MITIEATSFHYEIRARQIRTGRAAEDGRPPYDRPLRVRLGDGSGDNCMVTLRWCDDAGQVTATVSRAFATGVLPTTSIEKSNGDGLTVRVHIDEGAPMSISRVRRKG